jgi:single-stranded DNA-binding protein
MVASINRVVLLGSIGPRGVEMSYHGQGTAKAAFMLVLTELGSDGKAHQLWQPVEIWGKTAERVGEYDAGSVVVVDGKLRRVKKGENWETVVSSWDCTPLQVPTAVTTTQS